MVLRGTAKKYAKASFAKRPTYQNQIDALARQINKQKPETQYYKTTGTITSTGTGNESVTIPVTENLINTLTFRDNITGDRWANTALNVTGYIARDCTHVRCMVYVPKQAGDRFNPSAPFTEYPDRSSFWVISDRLISRESTHDGFQAFKIRANLKGLTTVYDSQAADVHRGEVVLAFYYNGDTAATQQLVWGHELVYHNK